VSPQDRRLIDLTQHFSLQIFGYLYYPVMKCPHCDYEISPAEAAKLLGKLAKGQKKAFSDAEKEARRIRLAQARKKRWGNKSEDLRDCDLRM
jgi:hypothetical protein